MAVARRPAGRHARRARTRYTPPWIWPSACLDPAAEPALIFTRAGRPRARALARCRPMRQRHGRAAPSGRAVSRARSRCRSRSRSRRRRFIPALTLSAPGRRSAIGAAARAEPAGRQTIRVALDRLDAPHGPRRRAGHCTAARSSAGSARSTDSGEVLPAKPGRGWVRRSPTSSAGARGATAVAAARRGPPGRARAAPLGRRAVPAELEFDRYDDLTAARAQRGRDRLRHRRGPHRARACSAGSVREDVGPGAPAHR